VIADPPTLAGAVSATEIEVAEAADAVPSVGASGASSGLSPTAIILPGRLERGICRP
jgi:hypothetical protein